MRPARLRPRVDAFEVTALAAAGDAVADPAVLVAVAAAARRHEVLRFEVVLRLPAGAVAPVELADAFAVLAGRYARGRYDRPPRMARASIPDSESPETSAWWACAKGVRRPASPT